MARPARTRRTSSLGVPAAGARQAPCAPRAGSRRGAPRGSACRPRPCGAPAGRRGLIRAGDQVVIDERPRVVLGASGSLIRFADDDGAVEEAAVAELAGSGRMRLQPRGPGGHPAAQTGLAGLPPEAVERARGREARIIEVVDGTPPDAPAGTPPLPAYDVERTSLAWPEQAKAARLSAPGRPAPASTV